MTSETLPQKTRYTYMMAPSYGVVSIMGDPEWILALLGVVILAGIVIFSKSKARAKSGYTIQEEKA